MKRGAILCNRCRKKMNKAVCACGNVNCYVVFYWKGRHYTSRRDSRNEVFDFREAAKALTKINAAMEDNKARFEPVEWTDGSIKQRRFENLINDYYGEKEQQVRSGEISPEHFRIIRNYYKNYYSFFDGDDAREIDRERLSVFNRTRLCQLAKIKSRRNVLNALHAVFSWLWENGHILQMPVFPTIKGNDATRRRALRLEEFEEALRRLPKEHRDPIEFMRKTGFRPGELCAVLVKSLDVRSRHIWAERSLSGSTYRETTKNKSKLPQPLNDKALEIARRNAAGKFPNDFLFVNEVTGRGYARKYLWEVWNKYSGTDVTLYEATRHSFCTDIVPLTDSFTGQRLMRHRDKRSTDGYYHPYNETLLDVVQRMDHVVDLKEARKRKRKGNES